ncbi:hypothetical protein Nmel_001626, partial [Mimus melanotis]
VWRSISAPTAVGPLPSAPLLPLPLSSRNLFPAAPPEVRTQSGPPGGHFRVVPVSLLSLSLVATGRRPGRVG